MRSGRLLWVLLLVGCGAVKPTQTPRPTALEQGASAYLVDGAFEDAEAQLSRAVEAEPDAPSASFLLADLLDVTGRPAEALTHYFRALGAAHRTGADPDAAVAAAMGVVTIRDRVEDFAGLYETFYNGLGASQGKLPHEAWFQLQNLRFGVLRRAGRADAAGAVLASMGCPLDWQAVGPLGPWVWTAFDAENPEVEQNAVWPGSVDLGPGRGPSQVRAVTGTTCFVEALNPVLPLEGVTWAKTVLTRKKKSTVAVRVQTSSAISVRVNGKEVFEKDTRDAFVSPVSWFETEMPAGAVEIMVKLGTRGLPSFSLVAMEENGAPAYTAASPLTPTRFNRPKHAKDPAKVAEAREAEKESAGKGAPAVPEIHLEALWSGFAKVRMALFWDDIERARELLDALEGQWGGRGPVLVQAVAEAVIADPSLPGDVSYERARGLHADAIETAPALWRSRMALADWELDEDRVRRAIALLTEEPSTAASEPQLIRRLAQTFLAQGWYVEAEEAIGRLKAILPTSCNTYAWQLVLARRRSSYDEMRTLAEQIRTCDVFSATPQAELLRSQKWDEALAEAERLVALNPRDMGSALDLVDAAISAGDDDTVLRSLQKARALSPVNPTVVVSLADAKAAVGDRRGARQVLSEGRSYSLARRPVLLEAEAAMDQKRLLADDRVDGLAIVREYQAAAPEYDSAAAYVLDRAVYRVDRDGSVMMVVHTIAHLKTDEAVEKHGELNLPGGASLLTARTIKADGRLLEPEEFAGKPSLSLPDLSPGDFVESEYVLYFLPNQIFPGGFDTERFYFKDFETAFHRSEMVVIAPADMKLSFDPRGPCPPLEEHVEGDERVLTWRAVDASPHPEEPLAPDATEFLPSIRVTAEATWENVLNRVQDTLAQRNRVGRTVRRAVKEATRGIKPGDHVRRRRAIYDWVLDNIEPEADMFAEASHIVAGKRGNRSRAFSVMLKAAGYKSRLALVHPSGADETPDALPSLKLYNELVVQVPEDGMIHLGDEYASYGYLPSRLRSRPVVFIDSAVESRIGPGAISHDLQQVEMSLVITPDGAATGTVRETLRGVTASQWRQGLESNDEVELRRMFQGAYLATAIPGAVLMDLRVIDKENRNVPLVIEYEVTIPGFAKRNGSVLRAEVPFKNELRKRTGGLPTRRTPLVLSMHVDKRVDLQLTLPEGMTLELGDDFEQAVSSPWGDARRERSVVGSRARLQYRTLLDVDRVPPQQYLKFLLFARKVDRISNLDVVLAKRTVKAEAEPRNGEPSRE